MDMIVFFTLSLCCWTAVAVSRRDDQPHFLMPDEVDDGQMVSVTCIAPIDYGGGECGLFRENSHIPFKKIRAYYHLCKFHVSSRELLGGKPVGSRVYFRCDYQLQQYLSAFSEIAGVTIRGSSPSPQLSVNRRFLSPNDTVEVKCSPPLGLAYTCHFYREWIRVKSGSCSNKLTGQQLGLWAKRTAVLPVNMTCTYDPHPELDLRSKPSNHVLLLVVDPDQAQFPLDCSVSTDTEQLESFGNVTQTFFGLSGQTVTVHMTNSSLTADGKLCHAITF